MSVVVVERHPDSGTEVSTFVDGVAVEARVITVDPGAGWSRADWAELRETAVQDAGSEAARLVVADAFDGYDDSWFITDGGL